MATLVKNGYLGALGGGSGVSLVGRLSNLTRSILSAFSGSLYLPSPSSCFTDVAGTTPCTVDTSVALMLDEMRTLGSELWSDASALFSGESSRVSAGVYRVYTSAGAFSDVNATSKLTIGKTYKVNYTVDSIATVGGGIIVDATGAVVSNTTGNKSMIVVATTTSISIKRNTITLTDYQISNISVREVTGIHATQATAGFRPVLRGKVKNYLLNSATLSTQSVTCPLVPMTLSIYGTGSVTLSGGGAGVLTGTGAVNRVSLTFTPSVALVTFTVAGSVTSAQLELGTVANPYVATGATVASSSYGPYWLDFDGVDDRMQLSAVPFQMADDSFVVAGSKSLGGGVTTQTMFGNSSTSSANPLLQSSFNGTSGLLGQWRDDAGTLTGPLGIAVAVGESNVATIKKAVNNKYSRKNGGAFGAPDTTVLGPTTFTTATIGASNRPTLVNQFNGPIYSIALGKGAITDSQLLTIERYVGQKTGVTI